MELLDEAVRIVGRDHVLPAGDPALRERYTDPYAFDDEYAAPPPGAVLPGSVAEVQELVRAANRVGGSFWVVSRGRNLGYGGAVPRDRDSLVLDLGRMHAVRTVDVEGGFAVVEPGVSFFELHDHLRAASAPLWTSVPDLGHGSVIGNALERGFGYTAYGQHGQNLCGLEVVLPDGSLLHTGMTAFEGGTAGHAYKAGFGPSLDGLFQQANLGIVTGAGVWLMPRPDVAAACLISVPRTADLAELVDLIRPLQLDGTVDSVVIVGNVLAIASQIMARSQLTDQPGPIPLEAAAAFAERMHLGFWNAKFGLYGRREVVDAKLAVVRRAAESIGAALEVREYPGDVPPEAVHPADRAQLGIPSGDLVRMAAWRGGDPAHTDFSLVAPTDGATAQRLVDLVRSILETAGLDHVGGFTMFGRHAIMLSLISFDRSSATERTLVAGLFGRLIEAAAAAGFAPYRAHPAFMDRIAALYDADDGNHRRTVERIKAALDPENVVSPGKQGIRARQRVG